MTDTIRDLAGLTALFANNNVGAISPQDLRDFLFTMKRPQGSMMLTSTSPTTIVTPGTFYKAAGGTQLSTQTVHYLFDNPVDNRLRYIGTTDCHVHIASTIGASTTGTNDLLRFAIAKNGTVLDHSKTPRFVQTGSDVGSTAVHGDCPLSTNDYLELWCTNDDAAEAVTLESLYLFCVGMFV